MGIGFLSLTANTFLNNSFKQIPRARNSAWLLVKIGKAILSILWLAKESGSLLPKGRELQVEGSKVRPLSSRRKVLYETTKEGCCDLRSHQVLHGFGTRNSLRARLKI